MILSCEKPTEIRNYPNDVPLNNFETREINLDTTKLNFKGITNWVSSNDWDDKISLIEIKDGNIIKRIFPHTFAGDFFSEKNILKITSDSILEDTGYPIEKLKPILTKHYLNIKNNYPYSKSPQFSMVNVTIDTSKTATELKEFLKKITRTFDELNSEHQDSLELRLDRKSVV